MAECIAAVESVFKDYAEGLVPPPACWDSTLPPVDSI
jgi:hypothetical protein